MKTFYVAFSLLTLLSVYATAAYSMGNEQNKATQEEQKKLPDSIIAGTLAVGFQFGVSKQEAEAVLGKYKLKYTHTMHLGVGRYFFNETGEKFLVRVPKGEERQWIDILKKDEQIKLVEFNYDSRKIDID